MLFVEPRTYILQYTKYVQKAIDRTESLHDSHKDLVVLLLGYVTGKWIIHGE